MIGAKCRICGTMFYSLAGLAREDCGTWLCAICAVRKLAELEKELAEMRPYSHETVQGLCKARLDVASELIELLRMDDADWSAFEPGNELTTRNRITTLLELWDIEEKKRFS